MTDLSAQLPLFIYGTLLPDERNHARYLGGRTLTDEPATVAGELWWEVVEDYPYLCPGDGIVQGRLVTIAPEQFSVTLREIDALEDFLPADPQASLYLRCPVEVMTATGPRQAWSYLWNRPERPGIRLNSGDFRRRFKTSEG